MSFDSSTADFHRIIVTRHTTRHATVVSKYVVECACALMFVVVSRVSMCSPLEAGSLKGGHTQLKNGATSSTKGLFCVLVVNRF